jgi:hypothetical protein
MITTCRALCGSKAYIQRGATKYPEGIICDTVITLSPPPCHAALSTIPHTMASVDQNPVHLCRLLPPCAIRMPTVGSSATKSLTNQTWIVLGLDPGLCGEKPVYSHLSCDDFMFSQ